MREQAQYLDSAMPNIDAGTLGRVAREVCSDAMRAQIGDEIDRGLILSRLLRQAGYAVVKVHHERCNWRGGMECNCAFLRPTVIG